jgi:hypothetical protein
MSTHRSHRDHKARFPSHHIQVLIRFDDPLDSRDGEERRARLFLREGLALFDRPFNGLFGLVWEWEWVGRIST